MAVADQREGSPPLFPFAEQEPFIRIDHRYYGYVSGVGAGKTHAGMLRTALNMERWNPGEMGAIVAPTTTMTKDVIIPLMRKWGLLDRWTYKSMHSDEPGIHAPNGSRALILSADNRKTVERLAGLNLAWFWLDEARRVSERAFEILTQRLRIGDYQNGYITTTPRGEDYIFDFFVDGEDGQTYQHGDADVHEHGRGDRLALLRVPTWANPFTGPEYKADMEAKEGQVYEEEVLGRFVKFEGLVYRWFDVGTHVVDEPPDPGAFDEFIYGVDWGFDNPSAILAIGKRGDEYVVVEEFYESRQTERDLADHATAMQERWGPGRFYCDPSEPSAIHTFSQAGLDARGAINDVTPGIRTVTNLQNRLLVAADCQALRNEFRQYQYAEDSDKDEPIKKNDHACDSLRYALYTHEKAGGSGKVTRAGSMSDLLKR